MRTAVKLVLLFGLLCPLLAHAAATVTETPGTTVSCYRGTSVFYTAASYAECLQRATADALTRAPGTYSYGSQDARDRISIVVTATPPPVPTVHCLTERYGTPSESPVTGSCVGGSMLVTQTWPLRVITPASGPGARACPNPLQENEQVSRPCTVPPMADKPIPAAPAPASVTLTGLRISGTAGALTGAPIGAAFRIVCPYSHMAFDDPIVYPGQSGVSHLHTFFGNRSTNANSTTESLGAQPGSTCAGGTANLSSYWVPAVVDTETNRGMAPSFVNVYYKGHNNSFASVMKAPPNGLKMVAGNRATETELVNGANYFISCNGYPEFKEIPRDCTSTLHIDVAFMDCWNSVDLDSPDHRSHMRYSDAGRCPAGWTLIPQITITTRYDVPAGKNTSRWRLSSDMYSTSLPGGRSMHGDAFIFWNRDIIEAIVRNCPGANRDCDNYQVGDGRGMF